MTGQLTLLLTADREHGAARTKVRALLISAGFEPGGRAILQKPVSPEGLDATMAALRHLHRKHKGITIRATFVAEWRLD